MPTLGKQQFERLYGPVEWVTDPQALEVIRSLGLQLGHVTWERSESSGEIVEVIFTLKELEKQRNYHNHPYPSFKIIGWTYLEVSREKT